MYKYNHYGNFKRWHWDALDDDDLVVKLSTPREHTWGSSGSKDPWIQWIWSTHSAEEERLLAAMHISYVKYRKEYPPLAPLPHFVHTDMIFNMIVPALIIRYVEKPGHNGPLSTLEPALLIEDHARCKSRSDGEDEDLLSRHSSRVKFTDLTLLWFIALWLFLKGLHYTRKFHGYCLLQVRI